MLDYFDEVDISAGIPDTTFLEYRKNVAKMRIKACEKWH